MILLFLPVLAFASGMGEEGDETEIPRVSSDELIDRADDQIRERQYDDAIPNLVDAVQADEEQLPAAEDRFEEIRRARTAYIAKGREVEAELRALISEDIPADQVVQTAFQALTLIEEMNDILPSPNPEDRALVADLRSRVLLTIDRRRFEALMAAAARELDAENYVGAVGIYVNGLGDYGFDVGLDEEIGGTQIDALLETDGIAIQIGSFDPDDYPLAGESFVTARETIRLQAVGGEALDEAGFTEFGVAAAEQARTMIDSFRAGEFENARTQVEEYLPYLRQLTDTYRATRRAGGVIAEQEALNVQRLVADEDYEYNWHIRFVNDLVTGRPTGSGDRREEGILYAIDRVWDLVADGPVTATREFGSDRYIEAITIVQDFPWRELDSPEDDARVLQHADQVRRLLERASVSYRTTLEVLNVSRELEIELPPLETQSPTTELLPVVQSLGELPAGDTRAAMLEAVVRAGSADQLRTTVRTVTDLFATASPLASRSSVPALEGQRQEIRDQLELLYAQAQRWADYATALDEAAIVIAESAPEHARYLSARIERGRDYELGVVRQIASIQIEELEARLGSLRSAIRAASSDLAATDPVSGDPRPRSERARDRLRPLVGTVVGTRVTSTSGGSLQRLRNDAQALAEELRADEPYITPDAQIQAVISRADQLAGTIGTSADGMLQEARALLQRSLDQIAESQRLERVAFERVDEISATIDEAQEENAAGNVLEASLLLDQAEDILSSNNPNDASNLFLASLQNWYRPSVEQAWDELREQLSGSLNDARRDIVLARVDILAQQAVPLLNPPPGEDARPGEAILLLEEAEALWETVYPLIQNPTITPLLRQARLLESQEQQVLTEDTPGFVRLSQIINTARSAFDDNDYATAQRALDFFLTEQPLNAEARLLDIRLELASGQGSADAIVRNYVNRSLDDVTSTEEDGTNVERAILSEEVSDSIFGGLLELRSKLRAIRQIVEEEGGAGAATQRRIASLLSSIEQILNPPAPPPPPDPRIAADRIIDQLPAPSTWQRLSVARQTEIYQELERARSILPGYSRAIELIQLVQSYLPTVRPPSSTEQAIMTRANLLVQQGDLIGALNELERYMAQTEDDPMLIPDWRNLYNDLQRRLQRR